MIDSLKERVKVDMECELNKTNVHRRVSICSLLTYRLLLVACHVLIITRSN
jgi:hypothetical protein